MYRLPFGDEGVLDFYLDLLAEGENEHGWTSDALRLVGNSCADLGSYFGRFRRSTVTNWVEDINRERVLAKLSLPALLHHLDEEEKADIAIGVLCNLCLDYGTLSVVPSNSSG